jgi:CDP-diacylglycerol--glycerol-3-phosphate 3-phosphatidyltransferase
MLRLVLTVAFVALLSVYRFPDQHAWALPVALVVFIVAALTDAADGYFARRWEVVSVFGRIMDPFADKILILGAFIMLAGPAFIHPKLGFQVSGVASWMVVVILGRELLVTTIRAVLEGRGIDFSAAWSGKIKMILQAAGVPAILLILCFHPFPRCEVLMRAIAWLVTLVTAFSAIPYITRAVSALKAGPDG